MRKFSYCGNRNGETKSNKKLLLSFEEFRIKFNGFYLNLEYNFLSKNFIKTRNRNSQKYLNLGPWVWFFCFFLCFVPFTLENSWMCDSAALSEIEYWHEYTLSIIILQWFFNCGLVNQYFFNDQWILHKNCLHFCYYSLFVLTPARLCLLGKFFSG
jgi:hypothetical protein